MRKTGLILLYLAGTLTFIGGLVDQFIYGYLEVHLHFLGNPEPSELLEQYEKLSTLILHSAGGGLMSTGLGMLALTHFGIRNNQRWAMWTLLITVFIAQGINAYGMFSAGSYYGFPVGVLIITLFGTLLYKMEEVRIHQN